MYQRNIIVCGTEINSNPTAEITWALILGLMRNMKQEVDNMFQGYWQTTIGLELKGKILGIIGLAGIPLDMMTITIAAIPIGIDVDNSIHFIYSFILIFRRVYVNKLSHSI